MILPIDMTRPNIKNTIIILFSHILIVYDNCA